MRSNFNVFLLKLKELTFVPDIIILTEIWIKSNETDLYKIPNYKLYSKCNAINEAGGVIVYILSDLQSIICDIHSDTANCLCLTIKSQNFNINVLAIYTDYGNIV